jgi:hypothetical protein
VTTVGASRRQTGVDAVAAAVATAARAVSAQRLLVVVDCEGVLCNPGSAALPPVPQRAADALAVLAAARHTTVAVWSARPRGELEESVAALAGAVRLIGADAPDGSDSSGRGEGGTGMSASLLRPVLDRIERQVRSHPTLPPGAKVVRGERSIGIRLQDVGVDATAASGPVAGSDAGGAGLASFLASVFEWTWGDDDCDLGIGRDELWITVGARSKGDAIAALVASSRPDAVLLIADEAALDDAVHLLGPMDRCITVGPVRHDVASDGAHPDDRAVVRVERGEAVLAMLDALATRRADVVSRPGSSAQSSSAQSNSDR